jgi:hypothetical protein
LRSPLAQDHYILGERLEANTAILHDRNGDLAGFAGVDVSDRAGFASMRPAHDFALSAVHEWSR